MKPRISAIIHTFNEESNIANAIRSVTPWVDEVLVIDMYSEDRTVEIARELGAKVFMHVKMGFVEPARAFAEEQVLGEWIFVLDADEVATRELSSALLEIAAADKYDICYVPRLNYVGGFPLMHTGWGPHQEKHSRFYRKGALIYSDQIHSKSQHRKDSRLIYLDPGGGTQIVHFCYLNAAHFIQKLNRYTDIEADQMLQQGEQMGVLHLVRWPILEFLNRYFRHGGFRDGWPGLYYSFLMAFYRATQIMKLREMQTVGTADAVRDKYKSIADAIITCHEDACCQQPASVRKGARGGLPLNP